MILLDTNVVIAFLNGNKAVAGRIADNIDKIALSALVVAELRSRRSYRGNGDCAQSRTGHRQQKAF